MTIFVTWNGITATELAEAAPPTRDQLYAQSISIRSMENLEKLISQSQISITCNGLVCNKRKTDNDMMSDLIF